MPMISIVLPLNSVLELLAYVTVEYENVSLATWFGYAPVNHVKWAQNYIQISLIQIEIQIEMQINQAVLSKLALNLS